MAYLIVSTNGEEVDRRELTGPVVVGRAPDCELPVRDILLSRRHCKFEPAGDEHPDRWVLTDLGSKNGTYVRSRPVTRYVLRDGDDVRAGRTTLTFKAGALVPAPAGTAKPAGDARGRPADPADALAGTVAGFILVEPGEVEREPGAPVPQPRPQAPAAYQSEDVFGMVSDMVASSWDSIMAENTRPLIKERPLPSPNATVAGPPVPGAGKKKSPRRPRVALSLQADPVGATTDGNVADATIATAPAPDRTQSANGHHDDASPVPTLHVAPPVPAARDGSDADASPRRPRWWHRSSPVWHHVVVAVASALLTLLLVGAWVAVIVMVPPGR